METENIINLKDGRSIFKTHNGFRYWLKDIKGNIIEVTEEYFKKAKANRLKQL